MKMIIDTDPGVDDAMALGIAFTWPNTDILAITCVNGNIPLDTACTNALKLQKVFGREDIPTHRGAARPLLALKEYEGSYWHGIDGLHNCTDHIEVDQNKMAETHAANCIIDLAKQHKGEICLVAIGPLTNLALAIRLCPDLPSLLKEVVILGGNYTGLGNITATAEFNFAIDPIAAHVVLKEYTCPMFVVPWETVTQWSFSGNFLEEYCHKNNDKSRLFKEVILRHLSKHDSQSVHSADCLAMCVALNRENMIVEQMEVHATVEPFGEHTHGMMIVDRRKQTENAPNITLITKVNTKCLVDMLMHSVS